MNERLSKSLNNPIHVGVASGVVSLSVGLAVGYILGKRKKKYVWLPIVQSDLDVELDDKKPPKVVIPAEHPVFRESKDEDTVITIAPHIWPEDEPEIVAHNVFAGNDSDWDYDLEVSKRSEDAPYVLHKDEFFEDERDYAQLTLTYYAGDDILTDSEDDSPIYNYHEIIGELKFGHGSGDPNVFYVRNSKRHSEYEVVNDPGLYSVEVLGHEIEANAEIEGLSHSRVPKFRME